MAYMTLSLLFWAPTLPAIGTGLDNWPRTVTALQSFTVIWDHPVGPLYFREPRYTHIYAATNRYASASASQREWESSNHTAQYAAYSCSTASSPTELVSLTSPTISSPGATSKASGTTETGAVIGGLIGGVVSLFLLFAFLYFRCRRRRQTEQEVAPTPSDYARHSRHTVKVIVGMHGTKRLSMGNLVYDGHDAHWRGGKTNLKLHGLELSSFED
ncbi:hypothetical protein PM082_018481 [Marasmius tenuissimus]|nr:hypothetical protein PM082_018481 [Marasmius tenuissimus]